MTFDVPIWMDSVDLVYYSPDGFEVDRENIELPEFWTGGTALRRSQNAVTVPVRGAELNAGGTPAPQKQ